MSAPREPRDPKLPAALPELAVDSLADEDRLEACRVADAVLAGVEARWLQLDEVVLERCRLTGATLDGAVLGHVRLEACDLSNAHLREAGIHRGKIARCKLTGASFAEARVADVTFEGCGAELCDFRFASLSRVAFRDCDLREADFQGAELADVTFAGSDLSGGLLDQARLEAVDLRGARLDGLRGVASLAGATVEPAQLVELGPLLASALGITVRAPGDDG